MNFSSSSPSPFRISTLVFLGIVLVSGFYFLILSSSSSSSSSSSPTQVNYNSNDETKLSSSESSRSVSPSPPSTATVDTAPLPFSSSLYSCTDDDVLRGFFGCQCGTNILITEPVNGPCLFGQPQRMFRNTSLPRAISDAIVNKTFKCQDTTTRVALVGDSVSYATTTSSSSNSSSSSSTSLNSLKLDGGYGSILIYLRKMALAQQCTNENKNGESGAVRAVPKQFWAAQQPSPSSSPSSPPQEKKGDGREVGGTHSKYFASRHASIENFTKSQQFIALKEFRPHVAIVMLGSRDAAEGNYKQKKNAEELYSSYYKLLDELIMEGTVKRIILVAPPPLSVFSPQTAKSTTSTSTSSEKYLREVVVPTIRKLASDEDLNKKLAFGSSETAKIVLVDTFSAFMSVRDSERRKYYNANDNDADERKRKAERRSYSSPPSSASTSSRLHHLTRKGHSALAALIFNTVCSRCTKTPLPLIPFDWEQKLSLLLLSTREQSQDPEIFNHHHHHQIYAPSPKSKTICPPGSTVDAIWGLSDPNHNSNDFYLKFNASIASYNDKNLAEMCGQFGKWITSNDRHEENDADDKLPSSLLMRKLRRTEMLAKLCRVQPDADSEGDSVGDEAVIDKIVQNIVADRNHSAAAAAAAAKVKRGRQGNNTSSSSPAAVEQHVVNIFSKFLKSHSRCEWFNKPDGWTPFQGPARFSSKSAAAFFVSSSILLSALEDDSLSLAETTTTAAANNKKKSSSFPQLPSLKLYSPSHPSSSSSSPTRSTFCYDFQDPAKCLYGKTVLFIGDSHVLNMAQMTCRMLLRDPVKVGELRQYKGPCGEFDIRFARPVSATYIPETKTTLAMFRLRYNLSQQMHRFYAHPWSRKILLKADFVVITRGMWDIVYNDTPKRVVFAEFLSTLKFLADTFANARIIVKILHYDHKQIWGCATHARQRDIRDATICATHRASSEFARKKLNYGSQNENAHNDLLPPQQHQIQKQQQQEQNEQLRYSKFSIFDSYGMTRQLPYSGAADSLGHHYQGAIQESLVQMMFSLMCPGQIQDYKRIFQERSNSAEISCSRVLDPKISPSEYHKLICGCSNATLIKQSKSTVSFCAGIEKANPVPFILDH